MKLVSYLHNGHEQLALLEGEFLYDTDALHPELPSSMNMFLNYWEDCHPLAGNCALAIRDGRISTARGIPAEGVEWLAPVPLPVSIRTTLAPGDAGSPANGLPQFRFADHQLVRGPGELPFMPDHLHSLSAAFSVAIVVSRAGRNIPADEAEAHIAGIIPMISFHAPSFQHGEVALALGPSLVTMEEGAPLEASLTASINGASIGTAHLNQLPFPLAQLIERASYGRDLFPGDIIAIPVDIPSPKLHLGDQVDLSFEGMEGLRNVIVADESDFSLLEREKSN